jgi:hypothetical protein
MPDTHPQNISTTQMRKMWDNVAPKDLRGANQNAPNDSPENSQADSHSSDTDFGSSKASAMRDTHHAERSTDTSLMAEGRSGAQSDNGGDDFIERVQGMTNLSKRTEVLAQLLSPSGRLHLHSDLSDQVKCFPQSVCWRFPEAVE